MDMEKRLFGTFEYTFPKIAEGYFESQTFKNGENTAYINADPMTNTVQLSIIANDQNGVYSPICNFEVDNENKTATLLSFYRIMIR